MSPLTTIPAAQIARTVATLVAEAACEARPDVDAALAVALEQERSEQGKAVLRQLISSNEIAARDGVPLCQDTGTVWVRLEVGPGLALEEGLPAALDAAVAAVYRDRALRMSVVADALLDRTNTRTNTPVFLDIAQSAYPGVHIDVMLKGAGSDNASKLFMLDPDAGIDGVERVLVATVREKASMACPPLIIGVGVGSTFDKVAGLAKRALLRPLGSAPSDPRLAALEERLLSAVNATGMGPGGLGGDTTALGVHLHTAPCHIAALPVAINMGCSALRSRSTRIALD